MLYTEAGLISTCIEAMLYGFSVLMFILTIRILLRNRRNRSPKYMLIAAAFILLVLATAEMIVNIVHICQGFLNIGPTLQGGPTQYFSDVAQPTFIIKSTLYNVQTLILDAVVIHRTYIVWQYNVWVVLLPILGWFSLFACTVGTNYALATAASHSRDIFAVQTGRWITANYASTLATNLSATTLLAYRIWSTNRVIHQFKTNDRISSVLRIVIESGAIYSVTITAALITFVLKNNGVYVILDMISPIICIVFSMIIVRVGLASDKAVVQSTQLSSQTRYPQRMRSAAPSYPLQSVHNGRSYELKPIEVEIIECKESMTDNISLPGKETDCDPECGLDTKSYPDV